VRIVGIVLVVLGSLALAFQSFASFTEDRGENGTGAGNVQKEERAVIPPVMSGIVTVIGLILLVLSNKRDL
jgi:hypothetical protein